jgi:hypothetical protein
MNNLKLKIKIIFLLEFIKFMTMHVAIGNELFMKLVGLVTQLVYIHQIH